jgi:type VI protein secretion system component Hcp
MFASTPVEGDAFDFTTAQTAPEPLDVRLDEYLVSSVQHTGSGHGDGSVPTETLTLNWDKVVWRYNDSGTIDDLAVDPNLPAVQAPTDDGLLLV